MWQCSRNHDNKDEAKFCGKCGEKRVVAAFCTECGTELEPGNAFCTSCGHQRDDAPAQIPAAPELPLPAPGVVEKPAPAPVVAAPPPPAPAPVSAPVSAPAPAPAAPKAEAVYRTHSTIPDLDPDAKFEPPPADEPVTFSFGGGLVEMKDDSKPDTMQVAGGGRMSSAQTAILSFVLFAAVLGAALYFVSR